MHVKYDVHIAAVVKFGFLNFGHRSFCHKRAITPVFHKMHEAQEKANHDRWMDDGQSDPYVAYISTESEG